MRKCGEFRRGSIAIINIWRIVLKNIKVELKSNVNDEELLKNIGFISEDILGYTLLDNTVSINISDKANALDIEEKLISYISKFISFDNDEVLYYSDDSSRSYYDGIYESTEDIHYFGHGNVAFEGTAKFLFDFFDSKFEKIAMDFGAKSKIYPVLLPVKAYQQTGYLKRSPQYAIFCCNTFEDIDKLEDLQHNIQNDNIQLSLKQPTFALSPSACFHTYLEYENTVLNSDSVYTFCQSVFRNEGRFNFSEIGRLMDYHVREIVMIGSIDFVSTVRQEFLSKLVAIMTDWNLNFSVNVAADPFIMPKIQKFKKIQKVEKSKYEVKLNCNSSHKISVASFNLHGSAFTEPFNIKVKNNNDTVTGCIGFGIERWVIAFICQYGIESSKWPEEIKNEYYKENKSDE